MPPILNDLSLIGLSGHMYHIQPFTVHLSHALEFCIQTAMRGEGDDEFNRDFMVKTLLAQGFKLLACFIFVAAAQTFNTGLDLLLVPRGQALSSSKVL